MNDATFYRMLRWFLLGAAALLALGESLNLILHVTTGRGWTIYRLLWLWANLLTVAVVAAMIGYHAGLMKGAIGGIYTAVVGRLPSKEEEKKARKKVEQGL